MERRGLY